MEIPRREFGQCFAKKGVTLGRAAEAAAALCGAIFVRACAPSLKLSLSRSSLQVTEPRVVANAALVARKSAEYPSRQVSHHYFPTSHDSAFLKTLLYRHCGGITEKHTKF